MCVLLSQVMMFQSWSDFAMPMNENHFMVSADMDEAEECVPILETSTRMGDGSGPFCPKFINLDCSVSLSITNLNMVDLRLSRSSASFFLSCPLIMDFFMK